MKTIWKFELEITDEQTLECPSNFEPLCVQVQRERLCLWAKVDPDSKLEARKFYVHGTGHRIANLTARYVGTVQTHGGSLVWHVFTD